MKKNVQDKQAYNLSDLNLLDFNAISQRIIYRLSSRGRIEAPLSELPYSPYLDLVIVYYVLIKSDAYGEVCMLIQNSHLDIWGISKETLDAHAKENTEKLLPPAIKPLREVISLPIGTNDFSEDPFLILSNKDCIFGATCILYDNVLAAYAEEKKSDIIVIPSSIHEVLLAEEFNDDLQGIKSFVEYMNAYEVDETEVLSNHLYVYKRKEGQVQILL